MNSLITEQLRTLKLPYVETKHAEYYRARIFKDYSIVEHDSRKIILVTDSTLVLNDYDPFANPQLFSKFSRIKNEQNVLDFIRQNGLLSRDPDKVEICGKILFCQNYDYFINEVKQARRLHDLLTLIIRKDVKNIKSRFKVELKRPSEMNRLECKYKISFDDIEYVPSLGFSELWNYHFNRQNLSHWLEFPLYYLVEQIALKLNGIRLTFTGFIERNGEPLNLHPVPSYEIPDLLTVMYFCFYGLLSNGFETRQCALCGEYFPMERKNIKYCPNCLAEHGDNIYMKKKRLGNKQKAGE